MGYVEVFVFWGVVGGLVAGLIWNSKGGSFGDGFLLGALLGIIGIIIVAVIKPKTKIDVATRECPHCKSDIRRDASVCPHCQRESEAWKLHEGRWWVRRAEGWYWRDERTGEWTLLTHEDGEAQQRAAE